METPARRRFLALAGSAGLAGLAGCGELFTPEDEGEFLVVNTNLAHSPGFEHHGASYPEDIVARVTVENGRANRQQGLLELQLRHEESGETWEKSDDLDVRGGISREFTYVFESAYIEGSDVVQEYEISGDITRTDSDTT